MNRCAWGPVLILVCCTFISYWNLLLLSPLQPFIAYDLGITIGQAAQLTTVSAAASIVSLIAFGLWGAKVSRRKILLFGMITLTLGSFLFALTDNYKIMLLIRVMNGLSDGIVYPVALVLISEYLSKEKRQLGVNAILAGTGLAAVVGIPLTVELLDAQNWQESFLVFSTISTIGVLGSLILPRPRYSETEWGQGGLQAFCTNTRLRTIAGANIMGDIAWFGALTFLGSFLVHSYNISLHRLSFFYFIAGVAFILGSFLATSSSFKIQRRWAICSSVGSAAMVPIFFSFTEGYWVTLSIAFVYGFIRAPGIGTMDNMLLDAAENTTTRVVSGALSSIIVGVAILIAASIGGMVLDSTAYNVIGVIFGISAFMSVLMLWNLKPETAKVSDKH